MSETVKIDWFWTPLFVYLMLLNSCAIRKDVSDIRDNLINKVEQPTKESS